MLAGDLNAPPSHPALAALAGGGWEGAGAEAGTSGSTASSTAGLETVEAPHRLTPEEREVGVAWGGRTRRVRLSDHDPVVAVLRAI